MQQREGGGQNWSPTRAPARARARGAELLSQPPPRMAWPIWVYSLLPGVRRGRSPRAESSRGRPFSLSFGGSPRPGLAERQVLMLRLSLALLCLWITGCAEDRQKWSIEERANWEHYRESRNANQAAKRILNTGKPFSRVTAEEQAKYVELQTTALAEAKKVKDDVLAKVHPDLPFNYRSRYQKSLELSTGSEPFGFEADSLYDNWVNWHNSNNDDFQFPKKAYGRGFGRFFLASLLASFIFPTAFLFLMLPAVGIVIAAVAVKGETAVQEKPPTLLLFSAFAMSAYVLWGWAAFMSRLAGYYAANPEATHGWLYYVLGFFFCMSPLAYMAILMVPASEYYDGFFFCMSPLAYMASKERDDESLAGCHTVLVAIAFVVFSVWPVSAHWLYGWLLGWFL